MSSEERKQQEEYSSKFFGKIFSSVVFLPIVMWIWPSVVPFGFFEFWNIRQGTVWEWLYTAWPLFAWGASVSILHAWFTNNKRHENRRAEEYFVGGAFSSLRAGVFEEITFRWLFFLNNIVSVKIANFLFFGFLGFGMPSWFHNHVFGPLANFMTLHGLESQLFHSTGWAVGAAMLTTNAFFRDGHRYQGLLGVANSWFAGMFLFWVMFHYGLLPAILIHFLYDFMIDVIRYVDCVVERAQGYA